MPGTRHEARYEYKGTLDKLPGWRKANGMRTSSRLWGNETQMNSSMQRGVVLYAIYLWPRASQLDFPQHNANFWLCS